VTSLSKLSFLAFSMSFSDISIDDLVPAVWNNGIDDLLVEQLVMVTLSHTFNFPSFFEPVMFDDDDDDGDDDEVLPAVVVWKKGTDDDSVELMTDS
jgi:hypothetical protein